MIRQPLPSALLVFLACTAVIQLGCGENSEAGAENGSGTGGSTTAAGGSLDSGGSTPFGSGGSPGGANGGTGGSVAGSGGSMGIGTGGTAVVPDAGGAGSPSTGGAGSTADSVWSALSVMAVENPLDHGAVGDGIADDLGALEATVSALPESGGIVYLPEGTTFRKTNLLVVTQSHVKFWAPNRQSEVLQIVNGTRRRQSILCRNNEGCGFFGLSFRSDATSRFDALEDNQISADHGSLIEVVGCEIDGSAATGIMLYGSREHYIHGNYVHHTWADHVHHTDNARASWVWRNWIFNESPSRGDDGIACVTYGTSSPTCGDMEWFENTVLHTDWGRGYAVIGGDSISIHDNFAIGVAGAGIIVASESSYDTASSRDITVRDNVVQGCGHTIGHPGILVSGLHDAASPLRDLTLVNNVSVGNQHGAYRAEGNYENVTNDGLRTAPDALPSPMPTIDDVTIEDTSVLRTRDVSHVGEAERAGLHRIHVRPMPGGGGFQERFEYAVKGAPAAVQAFADDRRSAGDHVAEVRDVSGVAYALVLTRVPVALPTALSGVSYRELRQGDLDSSLGWLWDRIDAGDY